MALFLVTGGAGFIGSHVAAALLARGERVRVLDNFTTGRRENLDLPLPAGAVAPEIVAGDVRDPGTVEWVMAGVDYVLHLAAVVSVQQSVVDPAATHEANVTGTLNVLRAAHAAGVKRLVLASSCAVYGDNPELPLDESCLPRPLSPYAASKLAGEHYCRAFSHVYGLPTSCLRFFNVYGPRQDPEGEYAAVIARFVQRMSAGLPPVVYGDGLQTRDFVYVGDVARACLLACQAGGPGGETWNVASGQQVSLLQLIDVLNGLLGSHLVPNFQPARPGEVRFSAGDGRRLATALGFRPETSLADGLKHLLASKIEN